MVKSLKVTKTVKLDNISIPYEPAVTGEKKPQTIEIYKEDMQQKWIDRLKREQLLNQRLFL